MQEKLPEPVKDKAARTASQARAKAAQAAQVWQDKAPEPVRARTAQGARVAQDNRGLLLAAGAALAVAWLVCRRKD